ncbi:MAG: Rpp14/Pop5 family protein [Nitrososphaerota archaeon]|nr:Rpp14/Pop5 family protein [Candidatus Bathyarchaeota archaeon]MDW8022947.1 Rpp14/Pop5 family protein [Nitrososphaerota archaeon]
MPIKVRRRYLALKIDSDENFSSKEFMEALWGALLKLFGEYGASRTGMALVDYYMERKIAIIRTAHTEVEKIRAVLASITRIAAKPAAVHVLKISGTIRALHNKLGFR